MDLFKRAIPETETCLNVRFREADGLFKRAIPDTVDLFKCAIPETEACLNVRLSSMNIKSYIFNIPPNAGNFGGVHHCVCYYP